MRRGGRDRARIISVIIAIIIFSLIWYTEKLMRDVEYLWICDRKAFALFGEFMPLGELHQWGMDRAIIRKIQQENSMYKKSP